MKPYALIYNFQLIWNFIACYLKESLFCKSHAYQLDLKLTWLVKSCPRRDNCYEICVCQLIRSLSKFLDKFEICRWKPKSHSWFEARCVNTKWSAWTGSSPCMKTTSTEFSPTKWVSLFFMELPCISICYMGRYGFRIATSTISFYLWKSWNMQNLFLTNLNFIANRIDSL